MASFPVWTEDDHTSFNVALAQFPDGSPSFLDDIAKHLQKPVEEVTHYYNAFHVPKHHRLVRWTNDDHEGFESARKQFEGSPSFLDDIAKQLQKPLLEVQYYYDKLINSDKDDFPHNPDQESDSEDDDVTETETRKRQRTQEDEDHRLDDNVLMTESSQRQRTDQEEHRLDDNVPVAEASQVTKKTGRWTVDEHRSFLEGLGKYGDGHWEMISRLSVRTRDAKQVANHADTYYERQKVPSDKKRRRPSYLDMTLDSINCKGKQDFGKKDPPDDGGTSQGSCLGV